MLVAGETTMLTLIFIDSLSSNRFTKKSASCEYLFCKRVLPVRHYVKQLLIVRLAICLLRVSYFCCCVVHPNRLHNIAEIIIETFLYHAHSYSMRPYFNSSPLVSYCLRLPTGGSERVMRTIAVRDILRSTAASKASMWWGRKRWQMSRSASRFSVSYSIFCF